MGILDSVLGGGSQTVETEIPGYIERPSEYIGNRIAGLLKRPDQRGFNATQQSGLYGVINTANAGNPFLADNTGFLSGLYDSGGLNSQSAGLAGSLVNGEAVNPAYAETARIANGGELGQNPFLESTFNRAANVVGENFQDNILANMDNSFAQRGRSGSRAYANARNSEEDAYGRQINDLANQVFGGQYNADLGRRDQALGALGGLGQQDVQNRLAGAGLYQQGVANQFGAVGASDNVNQQRYGESERLFQAGNTIQQQPYASLERGAGIIGQLRFPQQQTTQDNPNPFAQAIGFGTSIAGAFMPAGGAAAASDRRQKRDIRPIGAMPSGLPLYHFRYVWSDDDHIGVMAQEAAVMFPDAVSEVNGILAVDYARIG
jgi:hypothetical protein